MNSSERQSLPAEVARSATIETISRWGYIVHGLVHVLIGALAFKVAWGLRGQLADPPSAIEVITKQPMGDILVTLVASGLAAYALWRLVQAIADPDCQGRSLKGLFVRSGRLISGFGYAVLALFAGRLASGTANRGEAETDWASKLLTEPMGAMAGGLVGLILLCVATDDIRKACTTNFGERLQDHQMSAAVSIASKCAGIWGFAARAVILIFGGASLMSAVFEADPDRAKGFESILAALYALPYGEWLLGFVALGLGAYSCSGYSP